ncbi:hypothetical protein BCD67_18715 [Oscillatoriales cyanobacterium USR001]|nr:hypothetical protein BCD67_18715 [Oscillatoriales cyanobacterium USR001]
MLYLAEVQKQKSGFGLGGAKAELKLLACRRSEHNWSAVPGEELIPAEEANSFNAGTLVLVELSNSKQVQQIQEAARQLVSILQNFSRLQDKFKDKEEEIEQWKASLTFSSQELNRREMEMQAREEQLAQMEDELERLEAQRSEIESSRDEANRLRAEVDSSRLEMEAAWEQLRGEMQRMEQQQAVMQQAAVLDHQQAQNIRDLLERLSSARASTDGIRGELNQSLAMVAATQAILDQHWQQLEQKRGAAQHQQDEVDRNSQNVQNRWQEWQQAQESLAQARAELKGQQSALSVKQEQVQALGSQIRTQEDVYQQLYRLAESSDRVNVSEKVDVQALEKMPIEELQGVVQNLKQDLEKVFRFVNDQEEELGFQRQAIEELEAKIRAASEYDRLSLEGELADEQENYNMLNETLVGQRRSLREREEVLNQHSAVLERRLGKADGGKNNEKIDLGPVLSQLEGVRHQQGEELERLENQVQQLREAIAAMEGTIHRQSGEQEAKRYEIKQLEQNWLASRATVAELWGRVNLYQEMLQPVQDSLNGLRQKLEGTTGVLNQVQEAGDRQAQAIAQLREMLASLTN